MDSKVLVAVSAGLILLSGLGIGGVLLMQSGSSTNTVSTDSSQVAPGPSSVVESASSQGPTMSGGGSSLPIASETTQTEADPKEAEMSDGEEDDVVYRSDREERAAKSPVTKASKGLHPTWTMIRRQLVAQGDTDAAEQVDTVLDDLRALMRDPEAVDPIEVAAAQEALLRELRPRYSSAGDAELMTAISQAEQQVSGLRQ